MDATRCAVPAWVAEPACPGALEGDVEVDDQTRSYGARLAELGAERPDEVALWTVATDGGEATMTFSELDRASSRVARVLAERGLAFGDMIAVALRNSPEHILTCFAAWKLGAVPVPMRWDLPDWERTRVLEAIGPRLLIDAGETDLFDEAATRPDDPVEDRISPHGWGVCSSGSTGTPKVIVNMAPALYADTSFNPVLEAMGLLEGDQRILVPAPLYHTNGFTCFRTLLNGYPAVLLERFDAERALDAIEAHQITGFIAATPMLLRMARVAGVEERDLSSIQWIQQGAAPLPVWLGRKICELIEPRRFVLAYGASEGHGFIMATGEEFLAHPGTLGRPMPGCELKILDEDGHEVPTGEVGGIFLRMGSGPAVSYRGKDVVAMTTTDDGYATVGDLGWVDEEGYVFLADRRVDMIVTGGANVYPAEVEAALSEHPDVADVVVIGLRDEEWGHRVHAIVHLDEGSSVDEAALVAFAKERLAPYKVPKSVELVAEIPRTEAMKLNRGALVAEREPGA
jgi:bile acid-coenzyme A ligase